MTLLPAFLPAAPLPVSRGRRAAVCRAPARAAATPPPPSGEPGKPKPRKMPVSNSSPSARKLTRNKAGSDATTPTSTSGASQFADARAGDMVGAPEVGEGMGPRRGVADKKVTRAAAMQKSRGFADAWAEQNQGRVDVWLIIGALTLLTPILILVWGIATGVIPTGGLFDD